MQHTLRPPPAAIPDACMSLPTRKPGTVLARPCRLGRTSGEHQRVSFARDVVTPAIAGAVPFQARSTAKTEGTEGKGLVPLPSTKFCVICSLSGFGSMYTCEHSAAVGLFATQNSSPRRCLAATDVPDREVLDTHIV